MHKDTTKHKHHNSHSSDVLSADLQKIKAALANASHDMKGITSDLLAQSVEDMKARSAKIQDNMTDYVAEKPMKSLGIALLAGIAIGYLIHR